MVPVALTIFAAVLFVNAFFLLGQIPGPAAGPLNLLAGILGILAAYFSFDPAASPFTAVLVGTFGVAFFMLGCTLTWGFDGKALGYYSIFGAIICVLYATTAMADMRLFGMVISFAVLFALFAAILAFGQPLQRPTGIYTLLVIFFALIIPAFLMMTGRW